MNQRLYFVVSIDGRGFVFENISQAASFMCDAVESARQGRYYPDRAEVSMIAVNYDRLCELFPKEYKREVDADETTACTVPDQTEE